MALADAKLRVKESPLLGGQGLSHVGVTQDCSSRRENKVKAEPDNSGGICNQHLSAAKGVSAGAGHTHYYFLSLWCSDWLKTECTLSRSTI